MNEGKDDVQDGEQPERKAKKLPDLIYEIRTLPTNLQAERLTEIQGILTDLPAILENIYQLQEDWLKIINVMGDIVLYLSVYDTRLQTSSKAFNVNAQEYVKRIKESSEASQESLTTVIDSLVKSRDQVLKGLNEFRLQFTSILESITMLENTTLPKTEERIGNLIETVPNILNSVITEEMDKVKDELFQKLETLENQNTENVVQFTSILEGITTLEKTILPKTEEKVDKLVESMPNLLKSIITEQMDIVKDELVQKLENIEKQNEGNAERLGSLEESLTGLEARFSSPLDIIQGDLLEGKSVSLSPSSDIVYTREEHKKITLEIINDVIGRFSDLTNQPLQGREAKRMLIEARTRVYSETEKIAPRFRLAMDSLIDLFQDDLAYGETALESVVTKLQQVYDIYKRAAVLA